jgi:hypothetical protein
MAEENSTGHGRPEADRSQTPLADQTAELYEELAQRAEEIARTVEHSAEVHAKMPTYLLSQPDHAERERMLAAAEHAAAEAYRAHQVPPSEVRAAIRRAGDVGTTDPDPRTGNPGHEERQPPTNPDD